MDIFLSPRAMLPTMQRPSTGEATQRTYEFHSFSNFSGITNAFHTIKDYSHVTSIVRMERNKERAGLTTGAVCSAGAAALLPPPPHRLFVTEAPFKY